MNPLIANDIMNTAPGPELDALVAEKVMGWHITLGPWSGEEYWEDTNLHIPYHVKKFNPSTDISAAWEVVEKMNDKIHWFGIDIHKPGYRAIFRVKGKRVDKDWFESYATTAPEAICKAALLATLDLENI